MPDYRSMMERALKQIGPPSFGFADLSQRRDRKQRNQRLAAGAVGLAIALGLCVVLLATVIARSHRVPAGPPPSTPALEHNGAITVFGRLADRGSLSALAADGTQGEQIVRCTGSCTDISAATWSPDGRRLAFLAVCAAGCGTLGDPYHGIHVVDPASGEDRLVVRGDVDHLGPLDWSPDGTLVAYVKDDQIFVMHPDGTGVRTLASALGRIDSISWSPDGTRIAASVRPKPGLSVDLFAVNGSGVTHLADAALPWSADGVAWSPDGTEIAYRSGCSIWMISPTGGRPTRLANPATFGREREHQCNNRYGFIDSQSGPVWSPDGTLLAIDVNRDLFTMRADGSHVRLVSSHAPGELTWRPAP